jgi:hypothetical protein
MHFLKCDSAKVASFGPKLESSAQALSLSPLVAVFRNLIYSNPYDINFADWSLLSSNRRP